MCFFVYCRHGKLAFFQGGSTWQVLGVYGEGRVQSVTVDLPFSGHFIDTVTQHVAFVSGCFHLAHVFKAYPCCDTWQYVTPFRCRMSLLYAYATFCLCVHPWCSFGSFLPFGCCTWCRTDLRVDMFLFRVGRHLGVELLGDMARLCACPPPLGLDKLGFASWACCFPALQVGRQIASLLSEPQVPHQWTGTCLAVCP